jgi:kynurenine formamidase
MGPEVIKDAEKRSGQAIQAGDIVLFYTGHYDRHYPTSDYLEGYSGFTGEAAEYLIIEKKIKNWGVDSPSPDRPGDNSYPVHLVYRRTWVPHMENLCNLNKLVGRRFVFYGFPLKIRNGSGSPIRAVAVLD